MTRSPIRLSHLDEAERRAYRIADNKLTELGEWDPFRHLLRRILREGQQQDFLRLTNARLDQIGSLGGYDAGLARSRTGQDECCVLMGTGATVSGTTKTVNIGTGGVSGSTTNVTVGSAVAGALGTLTVNSPNVTFGSSVSAIAMAAANVSALYLGLGGATADATNRLSINAPASLFNHAGAGHQVKVNKAAATDTGSFLFQTGFSGRAEFGLTGSDDFQIKVSGDGATWFNALQLERTSGRVRAMVALQLNPNPGDPGTATDGDLWYNATTGKFRGRQAGASYDLIGGGGGGTAWASITGTPNTLAGYGIGDAVGLTGAQTVGGTKTLSAPVILGAQASDPASPANGSLWFNGTSGQLKAQTGGAARIIDAQNDVAWLTPPSGEYMLTTCGAGGTALTSVAGVATWRLTATATASPLSSSASAAFPSPGC